jgi:alpha-glucosidase
MRTNQITPIWIRANQKERLGALPKPAWPCNTFNNHDSSRSFSRYGDGKNDDAIARLLIALLLTLKGTPFLYNGEEIGMTNLLLEDIDDFGDNLGVWIYQEATKTHGMPVEQAFAIVQEITRDKCRTPMQWKNAPNGGFSPENVRTWLPVNQNYAKGINVEAQRGDPESLLNFYKALLRVRKENPALIEGDYHALDQDAEAYFAFRRFTAQQNCLIVLNYSDQSLALSFDCGADNAKVRFSSQSRDLFVNPSDLEVSANEILILEL